MGILGWLVLGLIAGALAQFIVGGNGTGRNGCLGIVITIGIGLVGAVIGGFVGAALGWGGVDEFDARSIVLALIGAVALLAVLRLVSGRR